MDLLFTNQKDRVDFCNFKAKRRIRSLESSIDSYDEEIKGAMAKCEAIFERYNADENYISRLSEIESKFHSPSGVMYGSSEVESLNIEKEAILNRYNDFLNSLPLSVREDLEFFASVVSKRQKMIVEATNLIEAIDRDFPDARDFDEQHYLETQTVFADLVSKKVDYKPEKRVSSMPWVVKSGIAPDALLGYGKDDSLNFKENEPVLDREVDQDTSFFNDKEDAFVSLAGNDVIVPEFEEVKEDPEEKSVTYTMATGDTLKLIAATVCGDENGWFDIYHANKELIDQRIAENKINPESLFFEDDGNILTGLTLVIPKMYTKETQVSHRL